MEQEGIDLWGRRKQAAVTKVREEKKGGEEAESTDRMSFSEMVGTGRD